MTVLLISLLQVHDGTLYVNGQPRNEPFTYQKPAYTLGKLVVPPGDVSVHCSTAATLLITCSSGSLSYTCLQVADSCLGVKTRC